MMRLTQRTSRKKTIQLGLALVFCVTTTSNSLAKENLFATAAHGSGELRYVADIPVAIFSGSPAEIGEQHAALLGNSSAPLLSFAKNFMTEAGMESRWPLAVIASKRLMLQAPERFRQEMMAAAEHANIDSDELSVGNTLLELRRLGCSALIIEPERSATGGPLFGRNFDFPPLGLLDKYSLVSIVRPEGKHAFAAIGYPGLIGVLSGMNDAGLAVATLDVYETSNHSPRFEPTGVPQMLVFRQILEDCTTIAEAEALLKRTKATTWSNLAVCDRDRGVVFEITPTEVSRRDAEDSICPCTNHFRTDGLAVSTDCWRYERLQGAAKQSKLDVEAVHKHLHSANQGELTLQTMVFEPRELVLHVAFGQTPSSALPFKRLELRELFARKDEGAAKK